MVIALSVMTTAGLSSCKGKSDKDTTNSTVSPDTTSANTTAPVEVSTDDALKKGVQDATKDYPTVTATVADGVITLTGSLERSKLQDLMATLHGLNPKGVENKLELK